MIPNRFYESLKLKNWMCELCTFFANPAGSDLRCTSVTYAYTYSHRQYVPYGYDVAIYVLHRALIDSRL